MAVLSCAAAPPLLRIAQSSRSSSPAFSSCRFVPLCSSPLRSFHLTSTRPRLPSLANSARFRAHQRSAHAASAVRPAEPAAFDTRAPHLTCARGALHSAHANAARIPQLVTAAISANVDALRANAVWVLARAGVGISAGLALGVPGALAVGGEAWTDAVGDLETPYSPDAATFLPFLIAFLVLFWLSNYVAPHYIFKDTVFREEASEDGTASVDGSTQQGKQPTSSTSAASLGEGKGFGKK
ncbi:unnamed protein product [Closterium sp. NIES-64]|nr:unnamed protein product [Closterium sp. NIES-65]CAI5949522.1 unnamed protein product [Closterium sp. NIES-64]